MYFPTTFILFCLFLVLQVLASDSHIRSSNHHNQIARSKNINQTTTSELTKRDAGTFPNARFTYFIDGLGACGGTNSPSDFIVALNWQQYGSGEYCNDMITISYNGKRHSAQITDMCPGCPWGALDLSRASFLALAPGLGEIYGEWWFGSGGDPTTSSTYYPPTTTSTKAKTTSTTRKTTSTTKTTSTSTWVAPTSTYSSTSSVAPSTSSATSSASAPTATGSIEAFQMLLQLSGLVVAAQEV